MSMNFCEPSLISHLCGEGVKPFKMHGCVFVCFSTKAMHFELVGDLNANSCIASLKRFIGQLGKPVEIFSDCGTNYIRVNVI